MEPHSMPTLAWATQQITTCRGAATPSFRPHNTQSNLYSMPQCPSTKHAPPEPVADWILNFLKRCHSVPPKSGIPMVGASLSASNV
ncbi:hypothetical protein TgHK011_007099 [Trichoderma gracile]|nr:hypothetical protein TgHK011_007099 [Trichoderma gracile]